MGGGIRQRGDLDLIEQRGLIQALDRAVEATAPIDVAGLEREFATGERFAHVPLALIADRADAIGQPFHHVVADIHRERLQGCVDGDGFVEYARQTDKGLSNQGWKDSSDSIFHRDGRLASAPIALCEVQGYVFAAKQGAAMLAARLGYSELSAQLADQAEALRVKFEDAFWIEEAGTYALALDGEKKRCEVLASNAGHLLFAGIASPERAKRVAELLTGKRFHSGWGVRTVAVGEARYNPMSYHNGSIWPHDNGLIALGLARYGHKKAALSIFEGIFDSAIYDDLRRLPELFCGFERRRRQGPTSYPVACSPQAWAAATPFALVAAAIGCVIDPETSTLQLNRPVLPKFLNDLTIRNIAIGDARVDLRLARVDGDVTTAVLRREGDVVVTITK